MPYCDKAIDIGECSGPHELVFCLLHDGQFYQAPRVGWPGRGVGTHVRAESVAGPFDEVAPRSAAGVTAVGR